MPIRTIAHNLRTTIFSLLGLLIGASAAAASEWKRHYNALGFSVEYPAGVEVHPNRNRESLAAESAELVPGTFGVEVYWFPDGFPSGGLATTDLDAHREFLRTVHEPTIIFDISSPFTVDLALMYDGEDGLVWHYYERLHSEGDVGAVVGKYQLKDQSLYEGVVRLIGQSMRHEPEGKPSR